MSSSKEQRKQKYVAKRKKPSGDSDGKAGKSVPCAAYIILFTLFFDFMIDVPSKRPKVDTPKPVPETPSVSDEKKVAATKRGRPPGSQAKNVLQELIDTDPDKIKNLWGTYKTNYHSVPLKNLHGGLAPDPCWIWKGGKADGGLTGATNQNGYGVVILGRNKSRLPIHVLSHYMATKEVPQLSTPKLDISHRCHKKKCFNPAHLVREEVAVNCSRDYCLCVRKIGTEFFQLCPHKPLCLASGVKGAEFQPWLL